MWSRTARHRLCLATVFVALTCGRALPGLAQHLQPHTPSVSGMPQGVPLLCANPTVTSVASGAWSEPRVWSTHKVPAATDKIAIASSHDVTYDLLNDSNLDCIEVRGRLAFSSAKNSRMKVGSLTVLDGGHLEIGSAAHPVASHVTAELIIADQPIDPVRDPSQIGTGLIGLGKVTMHGANKTPTFVRVRREPRAGQTTIELEQPVSGWRAGDHVVVPDTRQLRASERGSSYTSQTEDVQIASISGAQVTLTAPLRFNHAGARNGCWHAPVPPSRGKPRPQCDRPF